MDKLKPCPLCGGSATYEETEKSGFDCFGETYEYKVSVVCSVCGVKFAKYGTINRKLKKLTKESATIIWNRWTGMSFFE